MKILCMNTSNIPLCAVFSSVTFRCLTAMYISLSGLYITLCGSRLHSYFWQPITFLCLAYYMYITLCGSRLHSNFWQPITFLCLACYIYITLCGSGFWQPMTFLCLAYYMSVYFFVGSLLHLFVLSITCTLLCLKAHYILSSDSLFHFFVWLNCFILLGGILSYFWVTYIISLYGLLVLHSFV